jgi:putative FmdB family regulatory protein
VPLYVFKCQECDEIEEHLLRRMDAPHPVTCTACGKPSLKKTVAPSSFSLQGDGWARDNYGLTAKKGPA